MVNPIDRIKGRFFGQATVPVLGAAVIKAAATSNLGARFFIIGQADLRVPFLVWVWHRDGRDQLLDIGMFGILDNPDGFTLLGDRSLVQEVDIIANLIGRAQIVSDIQERDTILISQAQHNIEDHGAQRSIHHRNRLVGNDDVRFEQKSSGDHHPLALATA